MHGLGNDFMVINLIDQQYELNAREISNWADRHTGIGFDQLLVVSEAQTEGVDFQYRIFNADGSEVEQCGNGARCFARFVIDQGLSNKNPITVETSSGIITLAIQENGEVTVNMGPPVFEPHAIPLTAASRADDYAFEVDNATYRLQVVSMGNPHGVLKVDNIDTAQVATLGPCLENHPNFPNLANIGFMEIIDNHTLRLRVYERGVGETKACGTGACGAVVAAIQKGWAQSPVNAHLPGGKLHIEWAGEGQPVFMTGPATTVFEGTISV